MIAKVTWDMQVKALTEEDLSQEEYQKRISMIPETIIYKDGDYQASSLEWDNTFIEMASVLAKRSHCVSKQVACLITRDSRIVSTGINGTPKDLRNCDSLFKRNTFDKELHHEFSKKYEIHAEINALLSAARNGVSTDGTTLYVNYTPCIECAKSIIAAGIKKLVFKNFYENDLNGFMFLHLSQRLALHQVVYGKSEEAILNKIAEDEAKLVNIGKCVDAVHPFDMETAAERHMFSKMKFKPA